jgi:uracil DNA glycosylase
MKLWKELLPVLFSERMYTALRDLEVFDSRYGVLPKLESAMDMFRMVLPQDVRVVFVAQSPYPGSCPVTGVPYACGPAFLPAAECVTTPATLRNVMSEVHRDLYPMVAPGNPRDTLLNWISQGVMLLNSSLTLGTGCPKYLEDHSVVWEEIMGDILCTMCSKIDPVFVLVGKDAWRLESSLPQSALTVKVSHPVARAKTSTPWLGSGVFSRVSEMMVQRGGVPINWL